ncbi:hypothetical protein BJ912DRAFT_930815 [Pholiota molesta]|nr:hypothetical protein BJ912DRAFT_930815 [Pholiota molesta]
MGWWEKQTPWRSYICFSVKQDEGTSPKFVRFETDPKEERTVVLGQRNITVNDTDPSIQYQGGAGDALICKVNPGGTIVSGQGGCYNVPSKCTASVAMGQSQASAASFCSRSKVCRAARVCCLPRDADGLYLYLSPRTGSAIYVNSLLFDLSPLYTVTLDGNATDVDGFRSSATFQCETLFSRTGLDPTVNHTISLAVKSQSPSATASPGASSSSVFVFSLINFIYTAEDSSTSSGTSANASAASNSTTTSTSSVLSSTSRTASSDSPAPSNTTKSSSSTSMQSTVSGLHTRGLGAMLVLTSMLLSGAHFA